MKTKNVLGIIWLVLFLVMCYALLWVSFYKLRVKNKQVELDEKNGNNQLRDITSEFCGKYNDLYLNDKSRW